jgi:hypothetical protein
LNFGWHEYDLTAYKVVKDSKEKKTFLLEPIKGKTPADAKVIAYHCKSKLERDAWVSRIA